MATILSGLLGGLLGAIATAAVTRVAIDDPAPAATVWAMYFGDGDPTHYETQGLVVHALYGAGAGAVFAGFAGSLGLGIATTGGALLWALVWAGVLLLVAVGFWGMVLIGDELDPRGLGETGAVHLVFGVVLGLWVAAVPVV